MNLNYFPDCHLWIISVTWKYCTQAKLGLPWIWEYNWEKFIITLEILSAVNEIQIREKCAKYGYKYCEWKLHRGIIKFDFIPQLVLCFNSVNTLTF